MTIATPGRSAAATGWASLASALSFAASSALTACGPGVATPIPEPPTVNIGRIGPSGELTPVSTPEGGRHIHGSPGAAPAGSLLRATNLDRTDPAAYSNVRADGSFDLNIVVNQDDELRFDWSRGGERGAPQDAHFLLDPSSYHFESSVRFSCLKFSPGLLLDFGGASEQSLQVQNECASDVSLALPRTRLGSSDFALQTQLPLDIPRLGAVELRILFARTQPGVLEDALFIDVTADARVIRYPVTLLAPAQQ